MPDLSFPVCRHRGNEPSPGVRRCHSPKLVGLKLVTPAICHGCYCQDHEPVPAPADGPVRLLPCAHLGPEAGGAYECSHPRHGRTTEAGCRSCPDYLFPVLSPRTSPAEVRRLIALPPRPQPEGWWEWANVQQAHRQWAAEFIGRIPPYPGGYEGRGVVITGGGKYFPSAYVAVRVLRHVGCTLPVQLWHLSGEVSEPMRAALAPYAVECVDADVEARRRPFRFLEGHWWKGWQLKPYAIAHSPFREVLFLDADCYPARDPEFLFDCPAYRERGSIFWPDLESSRVCFPADRWPVFGLEAAERMLFESGQVVLNKEACWRELNLTLHYNAQADFTYRHILGDKDTFNVAWRRLGRPYAVMGPAARWEMHTIVQHDDRGRPLFLHRCQDKWRLEACAFPSTTQRFSANRFNARLPHEEFCFRALDELRGRLGSGSGPSSAIPVVVTTVSRAEPYLEQTLRSLAPVRPGTLMVGARETAYLERYRGDPLLEIVVPGAEEFAPWAGETPHRRAAWNYWRCLRHGRGNRRLLVFEDDVQFARGWEARLARTVAEVEARHADYVLSLYCPYPRGAPGDVTHTPYPAEAFYGAQGLLFAGRALAGFTAYLEERDVRRWTLPYDLLLAEYATREGVPLFATAPSLIQHRGKITTGLGSFHTAPDFRESVEEMAGGWRGASLTR